MEVPKDIGRPPRSEDSDCLYRLPELARENCQAAVNAGYARSAEDFWYFEQDREAPNLEFIRSLLRSIISAVPTDKSDSRNGMQRLDDGMRAMFGHTAVSGTNAIDDDEILERLAWEVEHSELADSDFRDVVRGLLKNQYLGATTVESTVRRIVGKFKRGRKEHMARARGRDFMPDHIEQFAMNEITSLLMSVGVPVLPES